MRIYLEGVDTCPNQRVIEVLEVELVNEREFSVCTAVGKKAYVYLCYDWEYTAVDVLHTLYTEGKILIPRTAVRNII